MRCTRSQRSSKASVEPASPGSPTVTAAAERAHSTLPAALVLQTGPDKPPRPVDCTLHISVLKELIGQEIREIIRSELAGAVARSPAGHASLAGGPSRPETPRDLLAAPSVAASGKDEEEVLPTMDAEAGMTVPLLLAEQDEGPIIQSKRHTVKMDVPVIPRCSTNADARHKITSDISKTGSYLHDLSDAKRLDVIQTEAEDRIEANELAQQCPSLKDFIFRVDEIMSFIGDDKSNAPPRSDTLSQIADSCWFHTAGSAMTFLNCAYLTYLANWRAEHYKDEAPDIMTRIDYAFWVFFALELVPRLGRHRWHYFYDANFKMNWMDLLIVVSGLVDLVADMMGSPESLRHLRVLRLLKVLRIVRVLRIFRTLRVVLESLSSTMTELFWCAVTLVLIQYMFALVLVMHIGSSLRERSEDLTKEDERLTEVFGSIGSTMLSLFTISMGGGDWEVHYKILSSTGLVTQAIYLFFVAFSFIALLNVILGIFIEKALKNLEPTKEEQAKEHAEEQIQMMNQLKALCEEGDKDKKGELSPQEWHNMFSEGRVCSYMDLRGFASHDLRAFFDLCAARSERGNVNIDDFVRGCMRLKGPSSCFDIQTLLVEVHQLYGKVERIGDELARLKPEPVAAS